MSAVPHPIARARAFCPTCDGLGMVGDDNPLTFPTLCPVCDVAGLTERQADQQWVEDTRDENLRRTEQTRHDDLDADKAIAAGIAIVMVLVACGIGLWGLWHSGFIDRVFG